MSSLLRSAKEFVTNDDEDRKLRISHRVITPLRLTQAVITGPVPVIDTLFPDWFISGQLQRGTPTACRDFTSAISFLLLQNYMYFP